jgi:transcriptional regulator with GAF, ATPase, and Fis domain
MRSAVLGESTPMDRFEYVLGASPRMKELLADLAHIAPTDLSLLVEGETGTGKELIAESVHRASSRRNEPYVVVDCRALTLASAEHELFGVEQEPSTAAPSTAPGAFELAHKGTLFLDELGDLPKALQHKLLRVLQKRELRRVGGLKPIPIDVRVVAATCHDLSSESRQGAFHQDLYYHVAAAHVVIPPLRDRLDDIPLLVRHFLSQQNPPPAVDAFPSEASELFRAYRWPGNVRELRHMVERLIVTPDRALRSIAAEISGPPKTGRTTADATLRRARKIANDAFEREYLRALLGMVDGNVTRAAVVAGVSRQLLTKLVRKHADVRATSTSRDPH